MWQTAVYPWLKVLIHWWIQHRFFVISVTIASMMHVIVVEIMKSKYMSHYCMFSMIFQIISTHPIILPVLFGSRLQIIMSLFCNISTVHIMLTAPHVRIVTHEATSHTINIICFSFMTWGLGNSQVSCTLWFMHCDMWASLKMQVHVASHT